MSQERLQQMQKEKGQLGEGGFMGPEAKQMLLKQQMQGGAGGVSKTTDTGN